jgi:hypothetical protein
MPINYDKIIRGEKMFLFLENDDVVFLDTVTALIRGEGRTIVLMRDGSARVTCFTPLTLQKRGEKFWSKAER